MSRPPIEPSTSDTPEIRAGQPDLAEAIRRADQLLDELRTTIAAIGGTRVPDLSAVIYELEVAFDSSGGVTGPMI